MSDISVLDLTNTAGAFATVKWPDEKLIMALANAAERRVSEFNAQEQTRHGHLQQ